MGQQTIGQGSLIISANADRLVSGLAGAEKKTSAWAKKTESILSAGFAGGTAAVATQFLSDSLKGIGKDVGAWAFGLDDANRKLLETQQHLDRVQKAADASAKTFAEWRGALTDPRDIANSLGTELKGLEAQHRDLFAQWQAAQADLAAATDPSNGSNVGAFLTGSAGEKIDAARKRVDALSGSISGVVARMADLKTQQERALDPSKDPLVNGAMARDLQKLYDSLDNFGKDPLDAMLAKWERTLPGRTGDLMRMRVAIDALHTKDKTKALADDVTKLTDSLRQQLETVGMSSAQQEIYALKVRGASDELLRQAKISALLLEMAEEQEKKDKKPLEYKLAGAAGRGSAEAHSIIARAMTPGIAGKDDQKKLVRETELMRLLLQQIVNKLNIPGASLISF